MKTKINSILLFTLCASLTFISCEEDLDQSPIDNISTDAIYSTGGGLEVGVNALYNRMRRYNSPGAEGDPLRANILFMAGTDLGQTRTFHRPYDLAAHTATSGALSYKWNLAYQIIDRANAIINNAPNVVMEQTVKNNLVAQARMVRGELYFDLLRMYDQVLLDTIATTIDNFEDSIEYVPASKSDLYALIDGDFDFAIANLTYVEDYGRYNQAVARLLRGKSALWQNDYQEAAIQFDALINDSGKQLVPINEVFGQNTDNAETLFAYTRDQLLGGSDGLAGGQGSWMGSVFVSRLYEQGSGDFVQTVEYGGQALGWSHPNAYLQSLYGEVTRPDPAQPWFKRVITEDLRYTNYYYPEVFLGTNPNSPNFGERVLQYDDNVRRYHFSLKKFYDEEKGALTNDSWKDHIYYRLAEAYLLGSEAHWRLGDNAQALTYINAIRRRAFGVNDASYDFTSYDLDTYLEESARELALEGASRWFLLKRLGLLVERQNLHYRYGSNSTNIVEEPMQPYMVNMPIPQSFIDQSGGVYPQNEGY